MLVPRKSGASKGKQPRSGDGRYGRKPKPSSPPLKSAPDHQPEQPLEADALKVTAPSYQHLRDAWDVLMQIAKDQQIKVINSHTPEDVCALGLYDAARKRIEISSRLDDPALCVVALAHELGHSFDPKFSSRRKEKRAEKAMQAAANDKRTACAELIAQECARRFCASSGIQADAVSASYAASWAKYASSDLPQVRRRTEIAWGRMYSAAQLAASKVKHRRAIGRDITT